MRQTPNWRKTPPRVQGLGGPTSYIEARLLMTPAMWVANGCVLLITCINII